MYLKLAHYIAVFGDQVAVEEASMTQVDHSTFTPQQLSVEKLIKEQNFTWKVRQTWVTGCAVYLSVESGGVHGPIRVES